MVPKEEENQELESLSKKTRLDGTGEIDLKSILGAHVVKVGPVNPVKDFLLLLQMGKKPVENIYEEMETIIFELLQDSGGSNAALMAKAQNCLGVYREHASTESQATHFNRWMEQFKDKVISNYFTDFWLQYVSEPRLGLITTEESSESTVSKEQAEKFLQISTYIEGFDSEDDEQLVSQFFKPAKYLFLVCGSHSTSICKHTLLDRRNNYYHVPTFHVTERHHRVLQTEPVGSQLH